MKVTFLKDHTVVDGGAKYAKGDSVEITPDSVAIELFGKGIVTAYAEPPAPVVDVKAAVDAAVATQIKALGNQTINTNQTVRIPGGDELAGEKAATVQVGEPVIANDPKRGFKSMGEFAFKVFEADTKGAFGLDKRLELMSGIKSPTGMGQTFGADGGFLVPPEYSSMIWDGMNQSADNLLARTDNYTVTGESLTFPANAETSRATGSRYGGVQGYWISEADTITASRPKLRQVRVEPKQLAVLCYVTDKLLNNANTALEQYITRAATEEINFMVGDAIVNSSAGNVLGILGSGCLVSVAKETGQAAATIVYDNVNKMYARMHPRSLSSAVWFVNIAATPQLNKMTIGVGTGGQPVYMPPGGISGSPYATLFGRPVIPIEYCSALGTVGDIIFADMKSYLSVTRGSIQSAMSMHVRFVNAESAFRFIFEVGGQPWLASAITPFKGSDTLSPFVALATRA